MQGGAEGICQKYPGVFAAADEELRTAACQQRRGKKESAEAPEGSDAVHGRCGNLVTEPWIRKVRVANFMPVRIRWSIEGIKCEIRRQGIRRSEGRLAEMSKAGSPCQHLGDDEKLIGGRAAGSKRQQPAPPDFRAGIGRRGQVMGGIAEGSQNAPR